MKNLILTFAAITAMAFGANAQTNPVTVQKPVEKAYKHEETHIGKKDKVETKKSLTEKQQNAKEKTHDYKDQEVMAKRSSKSGTQKTEKDMNHKLQSKDYKDEQKNVKQ